MVQILIDNSLIFEGNIKKFAGGGTKSAYGCMKDTLTEISKNDFIVLLPNEIDGRPLELIFPRICREERVMYDYLSSKGLLILPVIQCSVVLQNKTLQGLYAPSFWSYREKGGYIIDSKDSFRFEPDLSLDNINPNFTDPRSWIPIFQPLVDDLNVLLDAGVSCYGDCFNVIIVKKGSEYYKEGFDTEFQVRYFGFDFTSKRYENLTVDMIERGQTVQPIYDRKVFISSALDIAVYNVMYYTIRNQITDDFNSMFKAVYECICDQIEYL